MRAKTVLLALITVVSLMIHVVVILSPGDQGPSRGWSTGSSGGGYSGGGHK